jgi:hypothetical protein
MFKAMILYFYCFLCSSLLFQKLCHLEIDIFTKMPALTAGIFYIKCNYLAGVVAAGASCVVLQTAAAVLSMILESVS